MRRIKTNQSQKSFQAEHNKLKSLVKKSDDVHFLTNEYFESSRNLSKTWDSSEALLSLTCIHALSHLEHFFLSVKINHFHGRGYPENSSSGPT